ncbi:endo-1,4-beta-xylanase [Mucilaginibacter endophyticus]|uniref:endo-1,4-beta-xylanase n=1 Tax=Mucilaginibacter endophyticus TaxID=2675003 RepID=UPI000E0D5ECE|nr:endo-1,4-beta-xylanase [Mucilaginibacter endophyticus]
MKKIILTIGFVSFSCFFFAGASKYPPLSGSQQQPSLKNSAKFPIGVAVDIPALINNEDYKNIVTNEFNSVTTENQLKWNRVSPAPGVFNFKGADAIVDFAAQHNMRVHGHVLIYFESLPQWVQNFQGDSAAWEQLFKTHIQTIVRHYRGKVASWDVVNEVIDQNGNPAVNDGHRGGSVNVWLQHLGSDYVARAFTYAHEADPNAVLFYNDNGHESYPKKLAAIIKMANDLKARGIPIGGLGVQMHMNINVTPANVKNALTQMARTGLQIHISELDIRLNPNNLPDTLSPEITKQGALYNCLASAYRTLIPKSQQYGITFWGVSDNNSWIINAMHQHDSPLLFNNKYGKKQNYQLFMKGLSSN